MAIGQGYVLVTPLQLAVGYCGIATGKIMKPHLLKEVKNDVGNVVAKYDTEILADLDVDEGHLKIIRDALKGVGLENSGVAPLVKASGITCGIKTGTAEVATKNDFG